MSPSKSSRWCGLSVKKPKRKPTRSLFPLKKNSISRSYSWLKLIRRRSVKSMSAKRNKLMFVRRSSTLCS
uniref:Uncharacterized protein n=1 Tax=Medicago truncatula TaxID=3880 RepID=I3T148_MEDTR|nr:unknown [Medicago truncatula]AFK48459.1 unknown [Medicago truncatula]